MKTNWLLIGVVVLVAAFVFAPGLFSGIKFQAAGGATGAAASGASTAQVSNQIQCLSSTSPTDTINTNNVYVPGSDDTNGIYAYRKVGTSQWAAKGDDAATGTIEPFTVYEFVVGTDGTTESGTSMTYGPVLLHKNNCFTSESVDVLTHPLATAAQLTISYFDNYDRPNTEVTDSAGGTMSLKFRETGKYQTDYGSTFCQTGKYEIQSATGPVSVDAEANAAVKSGYGQVIVLDYNSTLFSTTNPPKVTRTSDPNFVVQSVAVPSVYVVNNTANRAVAFSLPALKSDQNLDIFYTYQIASGAALNDHQATNGNFTASVFDVSLYLDNNAGVYKCGAEDENGVNVGATGKVYFLPDSTAW